MTLPDPVADLGPAVAFRVHGPTGLAIWSVAFALRRFLRPRRPR